MVLNYYETRSGINSEATEQKDIIFIDYDGTEVFTFSKEELEHTRLPDNPSHSGLIAQGWNWTLSQIKEQLKECPGSPVYVGQMYTTESGATEIDIILTNECKTPGIRFQNEIASTTIDWGDGNVVSYDATQSTRNVSHEYGLSGFYTIKLYADNGLKLRGNNVSGFFNDIVDQRNDAYGNAVQDIRFGDNIELTSQSLSRLVSLKTISISRGTTATSSNILAGLAHSLQSITFNTQCLFSLNFSHSLKNASIPYGITSISPGEMFQQCHLLENITIPITVNNIVNPSNMFSDCYSLKGIVFPNGITQFNTIDFSNDHTLKSIVFRGGAPIIGSLKCTNCYVLDTVIVPGGISSLVNNSFSTCDFLENIVLSDEITEISQEAFSGCQLFNSIDIPSSVISIGHSAFKNCQNLRTVTMSEGLEAIYTQAFVNCVSLEALTIPSTVTQINNQVFNGCLNITEYHILPTTPPTLGTDVFLSIQPTTTIYVPRGCLTAYQTATNWSEWASYMQEEPA